MLQIKRLVSIAAVLLAAVGTVGCQNQTQTPAAAAKAPPPKPGPKESFELIVETFRRGVEDVPIGFVQHGADGHSMMSGKMEVHHKLIEPEKEGQPYKAIITVGSQSHYSIQRSTESEEQEQPADEQSDSLADMSEENGLEIFDRDLISSSRSSSDRRSSSPSERPEKTVTRKADRQERNYELVYEDGKWNLVTKLDPETERSIQNAFRRALATQI